ncbi:MAG: Uma2 family endonuclease [Candidatus Eremiobacteraeota bacterium]|nr:Uma2 family endonuclease [Candidatus Eremiobacteraeota bacterium]MBC5803813.1 Uma2 family endonuclease [Candidatus Eremiobacteraeota bacterium]MBC5822403.1 Uma2 family endonuclease [Candidatus Eremiobacteraeota bacterium]
MALIEVVETSREADLRVKLALYAESGIAEYWVVDLVSRVIRMFRDPGPAHYRTKLLARSGERIEFAAYPGESLAVDEVLPRPPPRS